MTKFQYFQSSSNSSKAIVSSPCLQMQCNVYKFLNYKGFFQQLKSSSHQLCPLAHVWTLGLRHEEYSHRIKLLVIKKLKLFNSRVDNESLCVLIPCKDGDKDWRNWQLSVLSGLRCEQMVSLTEIFKSQFCGSRYCYSFTNWIWTSFILSVSLTILLLLLGLHQTHL